MALLEVDSSAGLWALTEKHAENCFKTFHVRFYGFLKTTKFTSTSTSTSSDSQLPKS